MTLDTSGTLDEAFDRLHECGPEFEGWLTNHGPMAVEALVRHGQAGAVHRWVDAYRGRLEELPAPGERISPEGWREALGDPKRLGDWPVFFTERLAAAPWRDVLAEWWPRLLPGLAGGATHVVIRTGHAVRALLEEEEEGASSTAPSAPRIAELGHALAYWAARYWALPVAAVPTGAYAPEDALAGVPGIPDPQVIGIHKRFAQLPQTPGFADALGALRPAASPEEARALLGEVVRAATHWYGAYAHGNPVMLVHAATAPNAVLRTLPALPRELWTPSYGAAWAASAAVTAMYRPGEAAALRGAAPDAEELFARVAEHGDEHAIKFVDTALDVGDEAALLAGVRAVESIDPVG
ncbi:questin oxidase family protein [Streptomyces sp. A7024]|uniref:Questin oxidase family protein n=1 Tax=Streptomyces coryli TaxID=1128680 RepID=A0A6G4UCM7_9ACTN|nr:questin oxidase family protein [Streptomyces coryli]NGN69470.1 questin oxidase family protein [Streptomyces coryli]